MALIPEPNGAQPPTKLETAEDRDLRWGYSTFDIVVRLGLIGLLIYWALKVVGPFVTVALWSAILVVALYPLFEWLTRQLRSPRLAAILITLLCLAIVIGPVAWLGFAIVGGAEFVVRALDTFLIPTPPESVKGWPLIGAQIFRWWTLAATDTQAILLEAVPRLKPFASKLLELAGAGLLGLLEFIASIIIAGFLYVPGPRLTRGLRSALRRISGQRADEMMHLAGSTILNVSRGVVGIALVQSLLAGLGFVAAGIHGAGFLTFLALILGIVQIGAGVLLIPIMIWSWVSMETSHALLFTAYMIPVALFDNIFKPMVMARGLETPMPVILVGVIGGTIAYGISGLFLGPIILSVAWALLVHWVEDQNPAATAAFPVEAPTPISPVEDKASLAVSPIHPNSPKSASSLRALDP
jgi:predicted PurR-regulated permease PerM